MRRRGDPGSSECWSPTGPPAPCPAAASTRASGNTPTCCWACGRAAEMSTPSCRVACARKLTHGRCSSVASAASSTTTLTTKAPSCAAHRTAATTHASPKPVRWLRGHLWGSAGVWRQLMRGGPASRCCTWQRILAVLWHRRLRELEIPLRVTRQPANVPRQQRRRVGVGLPQRCVWHVLRRNSGANAGTLVRYGAWHAQVTTSHSWRRCLLTLLARQRA